MTDQEAINWAVNELSELFKRRFYSLEKDAMPAAAAMTALSGRLWAVQYLHCSYWVIDMVDIAQASLPHRTITKP